MEDGNGLGPNSATKHHERQDVQGDRHTGARVRYALGALGRNCWNETRIWGAKGPRPQSGIGGWIHLPEAVSGGSVSGGNVSGGEEAVRRGTRRPGCHEGRRILMLHYNLEQIPCLGNPSTHQGALAAMTCF